MISVQKIYLELIKWHIVGTRVYFSKLYTKHPVSYLPRHVHVLNNDLFIVLDTWGTGKNHTQVYFQRPVIKEKTRKQMSR